MMFWYKRDTSTAPSAYSIPGTRSWLNEDGSWSTFALDVGAGSAGSQAFSAVVSTSSSGLWLPNSIGCTLNGTSESTVRAPLFPQDCPPSRGIGLFDGLQSAGYNPNSSNVAQLIGSVIPASINLNYDIDPISLYVDRLQVRPLSANIVPIYSVSGIRPLLSTFGIGSGTIQTGSNTSQSLLNALDSSNAIARPSWGYTAGAKYGKCRR